MGTWAPPLVAFGAVVLVWELVATHERFLLPTIGQVGSDLGGHLGTLLVYGGDTLAEAVPGVAISYAVAVLLAVAMDQSRLLTRAVLPLAVTLNVSPLLAIAPTLTVVLGFGHAPKIVMTAIITFFPTLINALAGLRSADPRALEVFQSLSASRWETLWRLQLPASLPYLFAAARVVVPLSVVGAAIAEMVAQGSGGLGAFIEQQSANAQLGYAWAGIITLAAFGLVLTALVLVAEDKVLRWRGFKE
ncbi:MAG: ABC transporter permease [Acidimicrobiales bacterium]